MEQVLAPRAAPVDQPPVLMVFDGVLILSAKPPNTFQIGVAPASDHQFSIVITEFQQEPTTDGPVDSPISQRKITFADFPPYRRNWIFQVNQSTAPAPATAFDSGTLPNRTQRPIGDAAMDYRWPLNLHSIRDFPGHGVVTKQPGILNPVINFINGLFYTRLLTPLDARIFRKADGEGRELIGTMSTQFAANVEDIVPGGEILLRDGANEEIFKLLLKPNRKFAILFQNTPPEMEMSSTPGGRGHFPLFYSAFTPLNKRYDLVLSSDGFPGSAFPDPNPEIGGPRFGAPAPFRCGPVSVDDVLS